MTLQKFNYTRSPKLMKLYRTIPCQHCGREDGTVAGCHSNASAHGKGRGIKASDQYAASLCVYCHRIIDLFIGITREQAMEIWQAAHDKTIALLVKSGVWPKEVPLP